MDIANPTRDRRQSKIVVPTIGVSRRHVQVLGLLAALEHATAEMLARELEIPVEAVERILAELEEAGLIGGEIVH